jgi:hypothetical protein
VITHWLDGDHDVRAFAAPNNLMLNPASFRFLMQMGMIVGYAAPWPANVWPVNRGIKVPM